MLELEFPNLLADDDYMQELLKFTKTTPTSLVVNSKSEFILPPMAGAGTKENAVKQFKEIIDHFQND